ncbi:transposase family protein [Streptomyces sp. NBC_00145]
MTARHPARPANPDQSSSRNAPASIADVAVLSVAVNDEAVRIEARSTAAGALCPGCGSWSRRIHSSYLRFPADVPSGGRRVALCLRVRRFLCPVSSCGRRTFAEQLPGLTRRYGRRTERRRCHGRGPAGSAGRGQVAVRHRAPGRVLFARLDHV